MSVGWFTICWFCCFLGRHGAETCLSEDSSINGVGMVQWSVGARDQEERGRRERGEKGVHYVGLAPDET